MGDPIDEAPSPFELRHAEIRRQGVARHIPRELEYRQLLYGPPGRRIRHPLVSLMTEQDLGPCRHALAQRVVAGTLEVVTDFGPDGLRTKRAAGRPAGGQIPKNQKQG